MSDWTPESYRNKPARHQPSYSSQEEYRRYLSRLSELPPIVFPGEIEALKKAIAAAGEGRGFLLQGGDCVELFSECRRENITNKLKILLQMSVILTYAARRPVIRIGRMAGQYFKPRSAETEETPGGPVPVYRGDGINSIEPDVESRSHDPARLESAYFHAAATLNYVRAMISGGFADLHNPYSWNLYDMERAPRWEEYREIIEHITDAVSFMESFGGARGDSLGNIDFFTSHEALHLDYEAALTRLPSTGDGIFRRTPVGAAGQASDLSAVDGDVRHYNLGAHMLWIGDRTRAEDQAHVEYARGIGNPVGVKIGPDADPAEIARVAAVLSPENEPGKLVCITRLGSHLVRDRLPGLISALDAAGIHAVWSCDPMHGNTRVTKSGIKTRSFEDVLNELETTFSVHAACGSSLSGVHFELTGENVTECVGGGLDIGEDDLSRNYRSHCDPRLNYMQSMELSFLISRHVRNA